MISHTHQFIFVHAGRTGGTTFERMADATLTSDQSTRAFGNTDFPEKHCDFQYYKTRYPEEFGRYFKFTIVRNPYDRLVSAWLWQSEVVKQIRHKTFRDFIINRPDSTRYSEKFLLEGKSIRESIRAFDYIGRFEEIDSVYDFLCRRLNLPCQHIPHTNKTMNRRYQDFYDPETRRLATEKYGLDCELFGYGFEE